MWLFENKISMRMGGEGLIKYSGLLGIYVFSLVVIFLHPLDIQQYQWADDALYFNNAKSILSNMGGEYWLGPFNKLVISKAPFFSVFLVGIHYLSIPLHLAEFFLFAPMPFLFGQAVSPLRVGKWKIIYPAALCLVCIPVAGVSLRLLRTTLFGALSLYCMISLTGVAARSWNGTGRVWPWAVSAGLALGLAVTTREEALWLMLPTGIVILLSVLMAWSSGKFSYYALIVLFIILGYFLPVTVFSTLNYRSYGVYSPSIRQNSAFRDLYTILCSLQPEQRQKYVPINAHTRALVYAISPHFAQLKPYLEGPALDPLARDKAHLSLNGWGTIADAREFFVSDFEFALTEAIMLSGHKTGQTFLDFCRHATKEIRMAIDNKAIEHGESGFSMMPPVTLSDVEDIAAASFRSFCILVQGRGQYRDSLIQTDPPSSVAAEWHTFLGTWPPPPGSGNAPMKLKNLFFGVLVNLYTIGYPFFLALGLTAGVRAYRKKCNNYPLILVTLLLAWSGLLAFCLTIGAVDTLAFPNLQWPQSYNLMGFFPMHFLLLISVLAFFGTSKAGISWRLPRPSRFRRPNKILSP